MSQNLPNGLFSLLTADAGISALIGTRVYPVVLPENPTLPALLYKFVGGQSDPTLDTSGEQKLRLELDCYGASFDDASALRDAVTAALNGYQGTLSDGTFLQNAWRLSPGVDFFEDEPRQYRCMVEFYLLYTL
jgi:Protein of unknown function (DUF3168)